MYISNTVKVKIHYYTAGSTIYSKLNIAYYQFDYKVNY